MLTIVYQQTVRSNEQMMQSMKGATMLLGSMNRQMNLPALQRIAMEFERENEVMDERQEMMDDAIDEATGMEGEEEEGEDIVKEVLDEIGVDLGQSVRFSIYIRKYASCADRFHSWVKHLRTYNKPKPPAKLPLRKPLVVVVVAEAALMLVMMTSKPGWTAFDDDDLFFFSAFVFYAVHYRDLRIGFWRQPHFPWLPFIPRC
jgi:hypothetical protein